MSAPNNTITEASLLEDVKKYFPIRSFRPAQEPVIRAILSGRDATVVMPTGGGKSLCYQYPAVKFAGITLVISPLIALMQDQVKQLRAKGIPAACLNSSFSPEGRRKIMLDADAGRYRLLYVSPERLISPAFIRFARRLDIRLLVVDEAHCISLWGYDFRPDYLRIPQFIRLMKRRPVIATFTASASAHVQKDVMEVLDLKNPFRINAGYRRENLRLAVKPCATEGKKFQRLYGYLSHRLDQSGIVYCATVENVNKVCDRLVQKGWSAVRYYAELPEEEKQAGFEAFMSGEKKIMVATNAFGMGIDKEDIRYIIHFNLAKDLESYWQEIGRSGRDGKEADCILYYMPKDQEIFYSLFGSLRTAMQKDGRHISEETADFLYRLSQKRFYAMVAYAEKGAEMESSDLQEAISAYFTDGAVEISLNPAMLSEGEKARRTLMEESRRIPVLYTNETKAARRIRQGNCPIHQDIEIAVGRKRRGPVHSFRLDGNLTYFDLMVADAAYTLYFFGKEKFYLRNILELLSGDFSVTMKPGKSKKKRQALRPFAEKSGTPVRNPYPHLPRRWEISVSAFPDEREETILEGPFLPLVRQGKTGYRMTATPPLYRYAELCNGQFFSIPLNRLQIRNAGGRKMPVSIENLKLRHFLARRIQMMMPFGPGKDKSPVSRVVRLLSLSKSPHRPRQTASAAADPAATSPAVTSPAATTTTTTAPAMYDMLEISLPENPYLRRRKQATLEERSPLSSTTISGSRCIASNPIPISRMTTAAARREISAWRSISTPSFQPVNPADFRK